MKYALALLILIFSGCTTATIDNTLPIDATEAQGEQNSQDEGLDKDSNKNAQDEQSSFLSLPMVSADTGEEVRLSDYSGETILVETFAIWCPTCKRQQQEVQLFHKEFPEIITVTLDIDPNESPEDVAAYADQNGFKGIYAVSDKELTQSLVDTFGVQIASAPSVPMILVCSDQSYRLLPFGVKDVKDLTDEIAQGCSV